MANTICLFAKIMVLLFQWRGSCRDGSCGLGHQFMREARLLAGAKGLEPWSPTL